MNQHFTCQQLYHALAPNLDPEGFRLYRAAQKLTGFQPYEAFPYEDARGMFEALDGHQLMTWLEADYFGAVSWEVVPGTTYERAHLGEVDRNTPAYRRFATSLLQQMETLTNDCNAIDYTQEKNDIKQLLQHNGNEL